MTRDGDDHWGSDPADRWVMVRADIAAPGLWHADGASDTVESLPPIPPALARRIEAFADRYEVLDGANRQQFPAPLYWEQRPDFPIGGFNEEGRAIASAPKAALPRNWTAVYEDVDAWLRPGGLPIEARQVILPGRSPEAPA